MLAATRLPGRVLVASGDRLPVRDASVDVVTIGQYLRPARENLPVEEYVTPAVFDEYRIAGEEMGFRHVFSGPFVRSSYRAEEALEAAHATVRRET